MKRRNKFVLLITLLIFIEFLLILLVPILESHKHPLLGSLLCVQTHYVEDLYWNINQIDVSVINNNAEDSVKITLAHNIPNFDRYYFRTDKEGKWVDTKDAEIVLKLREGKNIFEVKAKNLFGEEITATQYTILQTNDIWKIVPEDKKIIKSKYDFRFEIQKSPKVMWLRRYTVPVVRDFHDQWGKYIVLRRWVREQIPFKDMVIKPHWDAQRILQTVWNDSGVGFICDAYAATYTSSCISVGLNARMMHLESIDGRGHYATEVWSDDYNKWVFMDPLFDWYFTIDGVPLSTLELHNLWKAGEWNTVDKNDGYENTADYKDIPEEKYFSLFHDIQLVNANDFLSNPFTSVIDLLTFKIRYIRWIDESNPKYNKASLATKIILYYYLPKISRICIIPVFLPFLIILISILFLRETHKSS